MTTYYVGAGGNNGNAGTSWALRKATLNGAEDIPLVAGDIVYVGPGNWRELLTVDVAGGAGNPITYIGDYLGTNTDGVGGVVRITGSDNDQTATRAQCINAPNARSNRTFRGFVMDTCTGVLLNVQASSSNWIVEDCYFNNSANADLLFTGTGTGHTIRRCFISGRGPGIHFTHSSVVDNANQLVENCTFLIGGSANGVGVRDDRIGGVVIKNSVVLSADVGFRVQTALTVGQTLTLNNCIITNCNVGVQCTTAAEFVENFNDFWANATDRSTVGVGANSVAYPPLFDPRWFMQVLYAGAGPNNAEQVITLFDLAGDSQLVNLAGTSPPTLDTRGTAAIGGTREWGPLEYDSTLKIEGGSSGGGLTTPMFAGGVIT